MNYDALPQVPCVDCGRSTWRRETAMCDLCLSLRKIEAAEPGTVVVGYWTKKGDEIVADPFFVWLRQHPEELALLETFRSRCARLPRWYEVRDGADSIWEFRGWSRCRLCGIDAGCCEYVITVGSIRYRIPTGYWHYVFDHGIRPDERLLVGLKSQ